MKNHLMSLISLIMSVSCNPVPMIVEGEQMLVIEGVIEDGHFPVVQLSATMPVDTRTRSLDSLSKNILLWARVTVSDGENEVVLTGRLDESRYPPYVYTTSRLEGESGKTYYVKATARGMSADASAIMPFSVNLEDIRVERIEDTDRFAIIATLPDNGFDYASFYVMRERTDSCYLHAYLSSYDGTLVKRSRDVSVMPGRSILYDSNVMYYQSGERVHLKFVSMDRFAYDFWTAYDDVVTLSSSPFFPKIGNLPTNINGGRGFWNAYGAKEYVVDIP